MNVSTEESTRIRGRRLDQSVLRHLRRMIIYSRNCRHREMSWYYAAGWEFAAGIIYGPLPPRQAHSSGQHPSTIATQFPAGVSAPCSGRPAKPWPMRKIIKHFTVPWNNNDYTYETLECQHVLSAPPGYSVPAKSRRCIHCAIAGAQSASSVLKKPASSVPIAKAKAVRA